ncbi:MAG: methylated-DNA--[protein]-cysteine S-methyltransferase [Nitrososphaerota archaeon]
MAERIAYITMDTRWGPVCIAASGKGVLRISLGRPKDAFLRWLGMDGYFVAESGTGVVGEARDQLREYLTGARREFKLPLDLRGTPFQVKVWETVAGIPYGELWSYRDVAVAVGYPRAWRAVGNAVGENPVPPVVPCHRVVRSDGRLGGYGGREDLKRELLKLESSIDKIKK